jgi:hypothetical protein
LFAGGVHYNPTEDEFILGLISVRFVGGSGTVAAIII